MTKNVFITGATDGLGLEMARMMIQSGLQVYGLGRRPFSQLQNSPFTPQTYCQADLSHSNFAKKVKHFFEKNKLNHLDFLIHNAGTGYYGRFSDQPALSIDLIFQVNLKAPIQLTYHLLPRLEAAKGHVTFVSSVATHLPTPDYAVYTATKKALEAFGRNLRIEQSQKITVQIIQPGAARTGMHQKLGISLDQLNWERFPAAENVAAKMAAAVWSKRPFVTIGVGNKALGLAGRSLPRLLDHQLARRSSLSQSPAQTPPRCLITGAADGIGKALAQRFGQAGYQLVGIDIDTTKAATTTAELAREGMDITFITADLSHERGLKKVIDEVEAAAPFDLVVHNAGINAVGSFGTVPFAQQEKVLALNYWAVLRLTQALIQNNRTTSQCGFIFLASLSNFVSYPGAAVYAATKAGTANFARQFQADLGKAHPVLTVYPGPTRTAHAAKYSPNNDRETSRMLPMDVADGIFNAYSGRRPFNGQFIPGSTNKLIARLSILFPTLMEWGMKKAIYDKLDGRTFG